MDKNWLYVILEDIYMRGDDKLRICGQNVSAREKCCSTFIVLYDEAALDYTTMGKNCMD